MLFQQRDLEPTAIILTRWAQARLPRATDVRAEQLRVPGAGLSNETILFQLRYAENGAEHVEDLVLRLQPTEHFVFPDYDLSVQWRILQALACTDVQVPGVRWVETDASLLGSPFYAMARVDGSIPSDVPPYHAAGVMTEVSEADRAAIWWSGIEELARIHRLDPDALGLTFLEKSRFGTDPLEQELGYWEDYLTWAAAGTEQPTTTPALVWLREHRPPSRHRRLCWGDARLPNMIFRDNRVAAVLDWEMAYLGDPSADLAWWLFLDWHHSEGNRIPRLPGLPSHTDTIARYEQLVGWPCEDMHYWEVFGAMRFAVIMVRVAAIMQEVGTPMPTPDFQTNNVPTQRLAHLLDLPAPGNAFGADATDLRDAVVRVQFDLTGERGYRWHLVADHGAGTRIEGTIADPDITVTADVDDWHAVQRGDLDRAQAFLSGKLKIEGDISLMMQLESMISEFAMTGPESERS
jgi:aminoglycoside phosphotransferase (APT) family kinase protein/putative sterol carrier protein